MHTYSLTVIPKKFPLRVEQFDQYWIDHCRAYHKTYCIGTGQFDESNKFLATLPGCYYSFKTPYVRRESGVIKCLQPSSANKKRLRPQCESCLAQLDTSAFARRMLFASVWLSALRCPNPQALGRLPHWSVVFFELVCSPKSVFWNTG